MTPPDDWLSASWQGLRGREPICDELVPLCREKPRTVAELVHLTDAKETLIRKALAENEWTVFRRVRQASGPDLWECRL